MSSHSSDNYNSLASKIWNLAHIRRDQGIRCGDFIELMTDHRRCRELAGFITRESGHP